MKVVDMVLLSSFGNMQSDGTCFTEVGQRIPGGLNEKRESLGVLRPYIIPSLDIERHESIPYSKLQKATLLHCKVSEQQQGKLQEELMRSETAAEQTFSTNILRNESVQISKLQDHFTSNEKMREDCFQQDLQQRWYPFRKIQTRLTEQGTSQEQVMTFSTPQKQQISYNSLQNLHSNSLSKTSLNCKEEQGINQRTMTRQRNSRYPRRTSSEHYKPNTHNAFRQSSAASESLPGQFRCRESALQEEYFSDSSKNAIENGSDDAECIQYQSNSRQSHSLPRIRKDENSGTGNSFPVSNSLKGVNGDLISSTFKYRFSTHHPFNTIKDQMNNKELFRITQNDVIKTNDVFENRKLSSNYSQRWTNLVTDSQRLLMHNTKCDTEQFQSNYTDISPVFFKSIQKNPGYETISSNSKTKRSISYPSKLCWHQNDETINQTSATPVRTLPYTDPLDTNPTLTSNNYFALTNNTSSNNTTGTDGSITVVSPYGNGDRRPFLQRAVSHEPRTLQVRHKIVKSPSWSETESEYVMLDKQYELPRYSRLFCVAETCDVSTEHVTNYFTANPHASNDPINIQNDHQVSAKNIASESHNYYTLNLYKPSKAMQLQTKNIFLEHNGLTSNLELNSETPVNENSNFSLAFPSPKFTSSNTDSINSNHLANGRSTDNTRSLKNIDYHRKRSKSLPDLQIDINSQSGLAKNYSDDEDGDDFGFLSYPTSFWSSSTSTAMNKAKSPSPGNRIFPKRWRSKTKAVPAVSTSVAMWTPGSSGSCTWSSVSGRKVQLRPVSILTLTEPERMVLQKVALSKLVAMDLGCPVSVPNENSDQKRTKKTLSLKRRSKSVSTSAVDAVFKNGTASGLVFGIPLNKCLINDRELEKRRKRIAAAGTPSSTKMRRDSSDNLQTSRSARKSSTSSQGSLDVGGGLVSQNQDSLQSYKRAASIDSLSESECSRNTSSSLIDALSLSTSNPPSRLSSLAMDGHLATQTEAQVPYVVKACFRHIETYGLQTLGIFRVGCSKKRVKQLREEFDSGRDVQLTEEHNPHDVGALLKEYFRDLPDPLLTRELYLPFLHAERIKDEHKRHLAHSLLISMLPVANRDTLWALLQFLATVSQHAADSIDDKGEIVAGNKMDAHNLATLFGPNIIHRTKIEKNIDKEMLAESAERVEQSKEIIEVVKDMIDNHHELYQISCDIRDEVLRLLIESNQEMTDRILRHIASQNQIETDPESMCSVFEDSSNSPLLHYSMNSDADLLAYAQKQTTVTAYHRPLRVTKSADDSLDPPVLKSRTPLLSESQAFSPGSRDNHRTTSISSGLLTQQLGIRHSFPSPMPNRVPMLKVYPEACTPVEAFPGRSKIRHTEHVNSEGYNTSLNIPQPLYFRKNSNLSINNDLYSLNDHHGGSENGFSGQWILPTPPTSRGTSPKPHFQSSSSSSTLVASPTSSLLHCIQDQDIGFENYAPIGSADWERDRWKRWEKIAKQKRNLDAEQETLV